MRSSVRSPRLAPASFHAYHGRLPQNPGCRRFRERDRRIYREEHSPPRFHVGFKMFGPAAAQREALFQTWSPVLPHALQRSVFFLVRRLCPQADAIARTMTERRSEVFGRLRTHFAGVFGAVLCSVKIGRQNDGSTLCAP